MKKHLLILFIITLCRTVTAEEATPETVQHCSNQARDVMMQVYSEILPDLTANERSRILSIARDACLKHSRHTQPLQTVEQTVPEQAETKTEGNDGNWFKDLLNTERPDKEGNKRLRKRMN